MTPTFSPGGYLGPNPPGPGKAFVYPSPARGGTAQVAYGLSGPGEVLIRVWNERADLVDEIRERKAAGGAQVTKLATRAYAPGVYLYRVMVSYDKGTSEAFAVSKFAVLP